jgi:hypothetical protein
MGVLSGGSWVQRDVLGIGLTSHDRWRRAVSVSAAARLHACICLRAGQEVGLAAGAPLLVRKRQRDDRVEGYRDIGIGLGGEGKGRTTETAP